MYKALVHRSAGLVRRWLPLALKIQPVFALFTGLACIFFLRRGFEYIPFVVVSIIFVFLYILLRFYILKKEYHVMITKVSDLAVTVVLSNILLFILPFYFESVTWFSRNMVFGAVIVVLTVIFNWYYLYDRVVIQQPVTGSIILSLTFFAIFNFMFPILFGMRNIWSLLLSGIISGIGVFVLIYNHRPVTRSARSVMGVVCGILIALGAVWFGRSLIPPAPLKLIRATACEGINLYRPVKPFRKTTMPFIRDVYFYSAIFAPRGLREGILHTWYYNGRKLLSIDVKKITGGRKEGFGTWSWHVVREGPGRYTVEVWTHGGQLLGEKDFYIDIVPEDQQQQNADMYGPH